MGINIGTRLKHAINAFMNKDPTLYLKDRVILADQIDPDFLEEMNGLS